MTDNDEARHVPSDEELLTARAQLEALIGPAGLDDAALWAEPSANFEDSLMAQVETATAPVEGTSAEAMPAGPLPSTDAEVTVLADRARRNRWLAPAAVAAAVLAVVAVVTLRPAAPDWEVALGATEEAAGVEATVLGWSEPSGTRVELDISGLDEAPDGFIYELWFSDGPIHISAGTFHNPDDVTLWAGVSRRDFPRLWITLEPLDNDPGPGLNLLDTEA